MEIYISNLSSKISKEDLKEVFEKYGNVASVKLKTDMFTGETKGYAFVLMPVEAEAKAAIKALNGKKVKGQSVNVKEAHTHNENWRGKSKRGGKMPF